MNMARPAKSVRAYVNFRLKFSPSLRKRFCFVLFFLCFSNPSRVARFFSLIGRHSEAGLRFSFVRGPPESGRRSLSCHPCAALLPKTPIASIARRRLCIYEDYGGRFAFGGIVFPLRVSWRRFCCARTNRPDRAISLRRNSALRARSELDGSRRFAWAAVPPPAGNETRIDPRSNEAAFAAAGSQGSFSLRTVWDLKPDRIRPHLGMAVWASARTERAVAGFRRMLKLNLACAACRPLPFFPKD